MRRKRLTPEEKAEIIRLRVQERMSSVEIAERMSSNTTTVCAIIKPFPLSSDERRERGAKTAEVMRLGLVAKGNYVNGRTWSPEENKLLAKLYPTAKRKRVEAAFPERNWKTIAKHASDLGIKRSRGVEGKSKRKVDKFFQDLREIREARGILRQVLADRMGIHRLMLTKYELGESRPGWLRIRDWLAALDFDIQAVPKNPTERARGARQWMMEEEEMLRELVAQGSTTQEISRALKRPASEVEKRALTLGILESEKTQSVSGMTRRRLN